MRNGVLKYLLKRVATDLLPTKILTRPKMGFSAPLEHWFRGDLTGYAYDLLTSSQASQRGIFHPPFIQDPLKVNRRTNTVNHSEAIYALLCLEHWFRIYIDDPPSSIQPNAPAAQTCN
jgi:asparagine synthase (glutamine-hydrolysing)